ncbi:MAG TPA: hypothetical protein PK915_05475 [Bacteroidales bacterium]|nr:hypothetical protein [Bacteroidales bacterium]
MPRQQNEKLYQTLRKKFTTFTFEKFDISWSANQLKIKYLYSLASVYHFEPVLLFSLKPNFVSDFNENLIKNLAFQIGLVELVSYWKAACPPKVIIKCGYLEEDQKNWWKKLYFNGLGEFFYLNGLQPDFADFMEISCVNQNKYQTANYPASPKMLVPVGGGKDSAVTLELMKKTEFEVIPFIINPRQASIATAKAAGFDENELFITNRTIDKTLLKLNDEGFLNGHTPFSAVVAFTSLLATAITGCRFIGLSNESSANEPTIPHTGINHQYSKSLDFERDFRQYASKYLTTSTEYFSLLRPYNELQIGKIFSTLSHQFPHFKSCNAGSKTDTWCGKCPKCLFTWIILAPFVEQTVLENIFGKNLLNDLSLLPVFEQLTGLQEEKPFECVGTIDEVNAALILTLKKSSAESLPKLLEYYQNSDAYKKYKLMEVSKLLDTLNPNHFVPARFMKVLEEAI